MLPHELPRLATTAGWEALFQPGGRAALEALLPGYIAPRRWFGAKAQQIEAAQIVDTFAIAYSGGSTYLTFVRLRYAAGGSEIYALPLTYLPADVAESWRHDLPHATLAHVQTATDTGLLVDALFVPGFCGALLEMIAEGRSLAGEHGALQATPTSAFAQLRGAPGSLLTPKVGTAEQSNTSIIYGAQLIMKLFRRSEPGLNPDLEIGRFLTERAHFAHIPPAAGMIEYQGGASEPVGLAFLQGFVPNQGDAWSHTLRMVAHSFTALLAHPAPPPVSEAGLALLELASQVPPHEAQTVVAGYLADAALLGQRTAALHLALASDRVDPSFAPEPFDEAYRQRLATSLNQRASSTFTTLRRRFTSLPAALQPAAQQILDQEAQIVTRLLAPLAQPLAAMRTRVHGDYHLGQVLYTGSDFLIIDFEGEPARPLAERRLKSSPLQDVAGMLRSLHYAPFAVLEGQAPEAHFSATERAALLPWAHFWHRWASVAFFGSYHSTASQAAFLPATADEFARLLDLYLLDKALYELAYELNNRPGWAGIPIEGILQLV